MKKDQNLSVLKNKSKLIVNLDLLKFHSFFYSKKYNNLWSPKTNEIKDKIINQDLKKIIKHFHAFDNFDKLYNDIKNNDSNHPYDNEHKHILFYSIIKECHPNLFADLQQLFIESQELDNKTYSNISLDNLSVYQMKLNNRQRLIFIYNNNTIYPLILDLRHCFYQTKKNYDNNKRNENHEWSFKDNQHIIKGNLIDK